MSNVSKKDTMQIDKREKYHTSVNTEPHPDSALLCNDEDDEDCDELSEADSSGGFATEGSDTSSKKKKKKKKVSIKGSASSQQRVEKTNAVHVGTSGCTE